MVVARARVADLHGYGGPDIWVQKRTGLADLRASASGIRAGRGCAKRLASVVWFHYAGMLTNNQCRRRS